jgi:hypothetical protein
MNNLEIRVTLDTRHVTETNKRRRKTCDIDYIKKWWWVDGK